MSWTAARPPLPPRPPHRRCPRRLKRSLRHPFPRQPPNPRPHLLRSPRARPHPRQRPRHLSPSPLRLPFLPPRPRRPRSIRRAAPPSSPSPISRRTVAHGKTSRSPMTTPPSLPTKTMSCRPSTFRTIPPCSRRRGTQQPSTPPAAAAPQQPSTPPAAKPAAPAGAAPWVGAATPAAGNDQVPQTEEEAKELLDSIFGNVVYKDA